MPGRRFTLVAVVLLAVLAAAVVPAQARSTSAPPTCGAKHLQGYVYVLLPCPTMVSGHPTGLTVTVYRWSGRAHPPGPVFFRRGTTRDRALIETVVSDLHHVGRVPSGPIPSRPAHADQRVLTFSYANGDRWSVEDDGCYFFTHGQEGRGFDPPDLVFTYDALINRIAGIHA